MNQLVNQLLQVGITPAGMALGALIITWLFIIFYLFPRLQYLDDCTKDTFNSIKSIKDKLDNLTDLIDLWDTNSDNLITTTTKVNEIHQLVFDLQQEMVKISAQLNGLNDRTDSISRSHKIMKNEQSEIKDDLKLLHNILVETRSIIKHVLMLNVMEGKDDSNSKLQLLMQYLLSEAQYGVNDKLKSKIDLLLDDSEE